jgi:6-phosphofructokinase 1
MHRSQRYRYGQINGPPFRIHCVLCGSATNEADFVLIPEVSLSLEGENGLLEALHRCILQKGNALIVVAEGAGQELFNDSLKDIDPSGNIRFKDIGVLLKSHIEKYFKERSLDGLT